MGAGGGGLIIVIQYVLVSKGLGFAHWGMIA